MFSTASNSEVRHLGVDYRRVRNDTLFDGTGVGLQDLADAASVVDLAVQKGVAIKVDFRRPSGATCLSTVLVTCLPYGTHGD